jgi:hypothetical protein
MHAPPERERVDAAHPWVGGKLGVNVEEDRHVDALARAQTLLLQGDKRGSAVQHVGTRL